MKNLTNYIILFFIMIVLGILYRRFEDKRIQEENIDNYNSIKKYLLDDVDLANSKKPILWIHIPYEYNSRKWLSFGSRSSFDLNQEYLYLTVRSIIQKCDKSFTICLIDDKSFEKLIPGWNINMNLISSPISDNMRQMGLMKILYIYGGLICPISFVCLKDLIDLYQKGTQNNKMFICENINRNITSTCFDFCPDLQFCGSNKENETLKELIDFIQRTNSNDFTAQTKFLGDFNRWCKTKVNYNQINLIDGVEIGVKTIDDKQITLDDLISQQYLNIYPNCYGILIPEKELLNRKHFEWFVRLSQKQILESNTILGNYILISIGSDTKNSILEPLQVKPDWVGFWKTPLYDVYGLKPNHLGNNMTRVNYPGE